MQPPYDRVDYLQQSVDGWKFYNENILKVCENGIHENSRIYSGVKVGKSPYVSNGKGKTIFVKTSAIGYIYLQLKWL